MRRLGGLQTFAKPSTSSTGIQIVKLGPFENMMIFVLLGIAFLRKEMKSWFARAQKKQSSISLGAFILQQCPC